MTTLIHWDTQIITEHMAANATCFSAKLGDEIAREMSDASGDCWIREDDEGRIFRYDDIDRVTGALRFG